MKKIISLFVIISMSIALFALDLNFGVDPVHNFDATATASAHLNRLEVGGGVYTNAVGNFIAYIADGDSATAIKDKMVTSFKAAEYGVMGHVYYDVVYSDIKLALGGIAELGSLNNIKAKFENKKINMNLLASGKATYLFNKSLGIFAQVGVPVATLNISGSDKKLDSLVQGSVSEVISYVRANGRCQLGLVLSI